MNAIKPDSPQRLAHVATMKADQGLANERKSQGRHSEAKNPSGSGGENRDLFDQSLRQRPSSTTSALGFPGALSALCITRRKSFIRHRV